MEGTKVYHQILAVVIMVFGPSGQRGGLYLTVTHGSVSAGKQLLEGSTPGREEAPTSRPGSEMKVAKNPRPMGQSVLHLPPVVTGVLILAQREEGGSVVGDLFNVDTWS